MKGMSPIEFLRAARAAGVSPEFCLACGLSRENQRKLLATVANLDDQFLDTAGDLRLPELLTMGQLGQGKLADAARSRYVQHRAASGKHSGSMLVWAFHHGSFFMPVRGSREWQLNVPHWIAVLRSEAMPRPNYKYEEWLEEERRGRAEFEAATRWRKDAATAAAKAAEVLATLEKSYPQNT